MSSPSEVRVLMSAVAEKSGLVVARDSLRCVLECGVGDWTLGIQKGVKEVLNTRYNIAELDIVYVS